MHQLQLSISKLPVQAHADINDKIRQIEEAGEGFVTSKILKLPEKVLCEIKEFYTSVSLTDQSHVRLANYFIPEICELEASMEATSRVIECLSKLYEVAMVHSLFNDGKLRFKELRDRVERQLTVCQILREHGRDQDPAQSKHF